ncbi:MAG: hypothetical protein JRJ20_05415 [Deltaproteobacteria bacterium]|nr:hypothetical protein [Deltaproteobacteria bacterium]
MDKMEIKEAHKKLLKSLGLKEEDFEIFDGKYVHYEYDAEKGVRIYDPYYATSYNEYIDVDGWSSWSMENDTFMSDILRGAQKETQRREALSPKPDQQEIAEALQKKFGGKDEDD